MNRNKSEHTSSLALTVRVANEAESKHIVTKIDIVSLDEKLIDICKRANRTNSVIVFDSYYTNSFLLFIDGVFPYIIRNGEFEWLVPLEDVTIAEFLHTHNIQLYMELILKVDFQWRAGLA